MFTVKISVDNKAGILKEGMKVNLKFSTDNKNDIVLVPKESVLSADGSEYVYVVQGGKPIKCQINTGNESNQYIEVTEGLAKEDIVIVQRAGEIDENSLINVMGNNEIK